MNPNANVDVPEEVVSEEEARDVGTVGPARFVSVQPVPAQPGPATEAFPELFDDLYQQLKGLARSQLRKRASGGTLCTTELVHELFVRFTRNETPAPWDRSHFMALSTRAMRQIVIDHARVRMAQKRGGEQRSVVLDETLAARDINIEREASFLLALDQALTKLEEQDPRLAAVSELRFFGGFTVDETAEILKVSAPTVKRDTRLARIFLGRALIALGEGKLVARDAHPT